jgi:hypothetical protein
MLNQEHYVPPHWEYNAENAPDYERKWGINLVWKWQNGVHTLGGTLVKKSRKYMSKNIRCNILVVG